MRTITAQKNDHATLLLDSSGNLYFRLGAQSPEEPIMAYPSRKVLTNPIIEEVEFTDDEDVKIDESVYCQGMNGVIVDMLVGPRPKNIVKRK